MLFSSQYIYKTSNVMYFSSVSVIKLHLNCNVLHYCVIAYVIRKQEHTFSYFVTRYTQLW